MPRFRYARPLPDELATGRPLAYGDEVELDADAIEANDRLVSTGALLALPEDKPTKPERKPEPSPDPDKETNQ